mmetsp:Transcript_115940/g.332944  ORF Transcript_115940/g.332944 Transcript_115940/m.332944 type:complete len:209 (+) Transcript_115940:748-1374(+)
MMLLPPPPAGGCESLCDQAPPSWWPPPTYDEPAPSNCEKLYWNSSMTPATAVCPSLSSFARAQVMKARRNSVSRVFGSRTACGEFCFRGAFASQKSVHLVCASVTPLACNFFTMEIQKALGSSSTRKRKINSRSKRRGSRIALPPSSGELASQNAFQRLKISFGGFKQAFLWTNFKRRNKRPNCNSINGGLCEATTGAGSASGYALPV